MDTIYRVKVVDRKVIKNISFKFPELMSDNSEELVKAEYNDLVTTQDALYQARDEVRRLEKELDSKMKAWDAKKDFFEVEFECSEKEVVTHKSYMVINGDTVYDCNGKR